MHYERFEVVHDLVHHNFYEETLRISDFSYKFIERVMICLSATYFLISINGESNDFLIRTRALSQAIVFPLLSVLVIRVFNETMKCHFERNSLVAIRDGKLSIYVYSVFVHHLIILLFVGKSNHKQLFHFIRNDIVNIRRLFTKPK